MGLKPPNLLFISPFKSVIVDSWRVNPRQMIQGFNPHLFDFLQICSRSSDGWLKSILKILVPNSKPFSNNRIIRKFSTSEFAVKSERIICTDLTIKYWIKVIQTWKLTHICIRTWTIQWAHAFSVKSYNLREIWLFSIFWPIFKISKKSM